MYRFVRYKRFDIEKEQSLQRNIAEHHSEAACQGSENVWLPDYPACERTYPR